MEDRKRRLTKEEYSIPEEREREAETPRLRTARAAVSTEAKRDQCLIHFISANTEPFKYVQNMS